MVYDYTSIEYKNMQLFCSQKQPLYSATSSIPNYKAFQEFWRVKGSQVSQNLYDKIIIFMTPIKYH
jgi:hypothetical protein